MEKIDNDNISEAYIERGEDGRIEYYRYKIYKKNKPILDGRLTREEMYLVYRLYTWYGDGLTARIVSRNFPEFSLADFKRILKVFNIYKDSSPFPPHLIEEKTEEELRQIQLQEKENSFLRKAEEDRIKNNEKLLRKYAQENIDLKSQLDSITNIKVTLKENPIKVSETKNIVSDKNLILHLSDLHIGAKVESGSLYQNEWNEAKLIERLQSIINQVQLLRMRFDTIVINILGDSLDGMDCMTNSRTHTIPQNMDNMEQVNTFVNTMVWFVDSLVKSKVCNNIKIYSVKCGNHSGTVEYAAHMAALNVINRLFPDIQTELFQQFFGYYKFAGHQWIITHGRAEKFMKKPLPLNLDKDSQIRLYEYIDSLDIPNENIHIIKGDLHSENINTTSKFDYRNVLSIFGASDYSMMNYPKSNAGCSYELLINNVLTRGYFNLQ